MDKKEKNSKLDKASKILTVTFKESVETMTDDDINELVTRSMQRLKALKQEIDEDEKLQGAKSIIKDMSEAYSATRKYEAARIDYLLGKLEERNGPIDFNTAE